MSDSPLECTILIEKLPAKLGKQCHTCRQIYPLRKFERRIWSVSEERLVVQEGRVCHVCTPPSAFDSLDFTSLPHKKLRKVIDMGLVPRGAVPSLVANAEARRRAQHAAKIEANAFRKWSAPWDHALRRLDDERQWALNRRIYMRAPRFDHMTQPADTFFNAYIAQLAKLRGLMRVQRRKLEYKGSAEAHKVMQPTSKWSDYMVDKDRRALEQAYWAMMHIDGNALGKRGAPLLLDAAPSALPMHGYAGVPAAEPPKYVTHDEPKRTHLRNMARSTLTVERVRELLNYDPDTGWLTWRVRRPGAAPMGERAGAALKTGYRYVCVDGTLVSDSHLAWLHSYGRWPASRLYRRNGVPDDNRLVNLYEKNVSAAHTFGGTA